MKWVLFNDLMKKGWLHNMCIAIVKPQNKTISDEYLENCFENNSDGAGIAYANNGKLYIVKGIFDKQKFIQAVRKAEKFAEGDMLIHCRIGTSGLKNKNNCHPHIVNNNLVMIHNGILNIDVPENSRYSNTVIFIKKYLKPLNQDFIKNKGIIKLIENFIGKNNKFAFLNNKGESVICNKDAGIVEDEIWYSNDSFQFGDSYFGNYSFYDELEIQSYIKESIDFFEDEEFAFLGNNPMIDVEDWLFVPYDKKKLNIDKYVLLWDYSKELSSYYQRKYNQASRCLNANVA